VKVLGVMDRYVQRQLWARVAFGFLLFMVFTLLVGYVLQLVRIYGRGAPGSMVWQLFVCRAVMVSSMCVPMAILVSVLLVFGRLSSDSEIVALQASGVALPRVLANAWCLGVLMSILGLALNEYATPWAAEKKNKLDAQIRLAMRGRLDDDDFADGKAFMVPEYDRQRRLIRVIIAKEMRLESLGRPAELRDVTYIQYGEDGQASMIINAARAEWTRAEMWRFFDAHGTTVPATAEETPTRVDAEQIALDFRKSPGQIDLERKDVDEMSIRELRAQIAGIQEGLQDLQDQLPRGVGLATLQVGLHRKLAIPLAALIFALVGAPLAIQPHRGGTALGLGLSLLIIAMYYVLFSVTVTMGENGNLSPVVAAWFANGVGLIVGGVLTWRASG